MPTDNKKELEGAKERFVCPDKGDNTHHWIYSMVPGFPVWIVQCSICEIYNVKDMKEQLQTYIDKQKILALKELKTHEAFSAGLSGHVSTGFIDEHVRGLEEGERDCCTQLNSKGSTE